jgi:hypothetical protein
MVAVPVSTGSEQKSDDQARLVGEFPTWHIWNSRGGRWWATRRGNAHLTREHDPHWSMTVDADSPEELRACILLQQKMALRGQPRWPRRGRDGAPDVVARPRIAGFNTLYPA